MRLDRLLHYLLPHGNQFYALFESDINNIVLASEKLIELSKCVGLPEREKLIAEIHQFEQEGDSITHQIFGELHGTFVTPFDREDIHLLASALDDILDNLDGSARRLHLYKVAVCPPKMIDLIGILHSSILELQQTIPLLRDFNHPAKIRKSIEKVNEYENRADELFAQAIADLFEFETNPIEIIKLKEIYVALETATDKCEDVANVIETLIIKHA